MNEMVLDRSTVAYICGVEVAKVRVEHLIPAIKKVDVPFDPKAPIAAMVEAFADWTSKNCKDLACCEVCGGNSPITFEACPYCGDTGSTGLALATEVVPALVYTDEQLNDVVAETRRLKADIASGYWRLGRHLDRVQVSDIWRTRKAADGTAKYKTFAQFCVAEFGMADSNVYRLISVSREWDEQTINELGSAKLDLVMRAPEASRPKLLERAREGASFATLKQELKTEQVAAKVGIAGNRTPLPPRREMITMVEMEGTKRTIGVSQAANRIGKQAPVKISKETADVLKDVVFFQYLVNDVLFTMKLIPNEAGELELETNIKRVWNR